MNELEKIPKAVVISRNDEDGEIFTVGLEIVGKYTHRGITALLMLALVEAAEEGKIPPEEILEQMKKSFSLDRIAVN